MPTKASLTLRSVKGSPLSTAEMDGNLSALRDQSIGFADDGSTVLSVDSGNTITIAGAGTVSTAIAGSTLTVTGTGISASSTDTLTNKTIDANGTGNSITNLEIADLAAGVLDTDLTSVSASDDTLASAKAIKTYADTKIANVVEDTTPQLGGNLDTNGNNIVGAPAGGGVTIQGGGSGATNITLAPGGSGNVVLSSLVFPNSDGTAGQVLSTNGSGTLSFATKIGNVVEDTTPQLGGALDTNGSAINFGDNDKATFGDSEDLWLYHDGTTSYLYDRGTGNLRIISDSTVSIDGVGGAEFMAQFVSNGAVSLYYDNGKKFETTSSGIKTTGTVNVNNAYSLPTADGTSNQVLTTNGAGTLSFAARLADVVEDTTPQLGGSLDVNSQSIVSTSNGHIILAPNGSGVVKINDDTTAVDYGNYGAPSITYVDTGTGATFGLIQFLEGTEVSSGTSENKQIIKLQFDKGDAYTIPASSAPGDLGVDFKYSYDNELVELNALGGPLILDAYGHNGNSYAQQDIQVSGSGIFLKSPTTFEDTYYKETVQTPTSSTEIAIDCEAGTCSRVALSHNTTFVFQNMVAGMSHTLTIVNQGSYTASFWDSNDADVKFPGGAPTITSGAGKIDVVTVFYNGTEFLGNIAQDYQA